MGEVYRARDTKLNRDVAIKVLPDLFAPDAVVRRRIRGDPIPEVLPRFFLVPEAGLEPALPFGRGF
jgi:hypothetical protein